MFSDGFETGFDGGVQQMAIDPDVQVLLDALEARTAVLEQKPIRQPNQITLNFPDGTTVSYILQVV